jgi:hypothetical protein
MLYHNIMKSFLIFLSILSSTRAVGACSYVFPQRFEAIAELDALFEGRVVAVYLNGVQSSTQEFRQTLLQSDTQVHIRLKIAPSRHYFGVTDAIFEVHTWYDSRRSCANSFFFDTANDIWGVTLDDGKFIASDYSAYLAAVARETILAASTYQDVLISQSIPHASTTAQTFVQAELAQLNSILDGTRSDNHPTFISHSQVLYKLPQTVLEARVVFLRAIEDMEAMIATQAAILVNDDKVAER